MEIKESTGDQQHVDISKLPSGSVVKFALATNNYFLILDKDDFMVRLNGAETEYPIALARLTDGKIHHCEKDTKNVYLVPGYFQKT